MGKVFPFNKAAAQHDSDIAERRQRQQERQRKAAEEEALWRELRNEAAHNVKRRSLASHNRSRTPRPVRSKNTAEERERLVEEYVQALRAHTFWHAERLDEGKDVPDAAQPNKFHMPYIRFLVVCRLEGLFYPPPPNLKPLQRRATKLIDAHLRELGCYGEDEGEAFIGVPREISDQMHRLMHFEGFCRRAIRKKARAIIRAAPPEERKKIIETFRELVPKLREVQREMRAKRQNRND
jgi:hypothetical protein